MFTVVPTIMFSCIVDMDNALCRQYLGNKLTFGGREVGREGRKEGRKEGGGREGGRREGGHNLMWWQLWSGCILSNPSEAW